MWLIGIIDSWIDAHLYDVRAYRRRAAESRGRQSRGERTNYLTVGFTLEW